MICNLGFLAISRPWTTGRLLGPRRNSVVARSLSHEITKTIALLLAACGHASCGFAEARSPLCLFYDGHRPEDPVYLNEFLKAKESPAISCVQQTAIRLSRGSDTVTIIANAAVSACDGEAIKEASEVSGKDGKPEKVLADIRYTMMRSALVAIITMRTGRCFD